MNPPTSPLLLPRQKKRTNPSSHSNEQAWTAAIIGMVLLVAAYSLSETPPPVITPERRPAAAVQMITPEAVPLVTGDEAIPELFTHAGCPVCHTIPGIQGTAGRVGPMLLLGTTGPRRLADPRYHGQAKTVHEYIAESIMSPGVYVVSGYPDRTMPTWYGQKLSAAALEKMAVYLEQVTDEDVLPSR